MPTNPIIYEHRRIIKPINTNHTGHYHPIRIKATIEVFLEEFDPSQNYLLSISDIEGYETQFIEFEIWDKNDGPIPGIKLFKELNIYLEREFCEY